MMEILNIKPFTLEYAAKVKELCFLHGERRIRSHTKYLEDGTTGFSWVVLGDAGEVIGFTGYNPDVPEMDSVTVINRICRKRGMAEALLKLKVEHARSLGLHKYVTTIGCTNVGSINLALKLGFTLLQAEERDYGQVLIFERELNR